LIWAGLYMMALAIFIFYFVKSIKQIPKLANEQQPL